MERIGVTKMETVNTAVVIRESLPRELLRPIVPPSMSSISMKADADLETAQFISLSITIPQKTVIPDSDLMLKYALEVEVEAMSDGYVIRCGYLDEDTFASRYEEAYLEFLASLRDRYYSLCKRKDRLSLQDLSILERFRDILVPQSS